MHTHLDPATDLTFVPRPPAPDAPVSARPSRIRERGPGVEVHLGAVWAPGDATLLLEAARRALTGGAELRLVHAGAGGTALLRGVAADHPGLAVHELLAGPGGCAPAEAPPVRWVRKPLPAAGNLAGAIAVTGGLGGIGLWLAEALAEAGHPIWLVDRREVSQLAVAEQHRLALLARRVRLVVTRADATHRPPAAPFPIRHLVLAAGELDLCPAADLDPAVLEGSCTAKADSLAAWLPALAGAGLASVVAFGSAESRRPHRMFAGYALTNELLRQEAARLRPRFPGVRIVVAEWSLWSGYGMAAQAAHLAAFAGFAVVPPQWGAAATLALLTAPKAPEEVVLGGPQSAPGQPVCAVAGVGGSAHATDQATAERLLQLCRPPGAGRARVRELGGEGPVLRAVVRGRRVGRWRAPADRWKVPAGERS